MAHRFRLLNVFTRDAAPFSGNPLCVFENGADIDAATMQALARQFNLSETTFVLPSTAAAARVRIFTPAYEMPFAGHPTLGTAHVCRALQLGGSSLTLEMEAGNIPVQAVGNRWTLTAPTPTWRELGTSVAALAAALGLEATDIAQRPMWVSAGKEQLMVPLTTPEAVHRTRPRFDAVAALPSANAVGMVYVFSPTAKERVTARFFFPQDAALLEDPATGSAAANYGGWCLAMQQTLPLRVEIFQGDSIGRPSSLYVDVAQDRHVRVSGDVVDIGVGSVDLS